MARKGFFFSGHLTNSRFSLNSLGVQKKKTLCEPVLLTSTFLVGRNKARKPIAIKSADFGSLKISRSRAWVHNLSRLLHNRGTTRNSFGVQKKKYFTHHFSRPFQKKTFFFLDTERNWITSRFFFWNTLYTAVLKMVDFEVASKMVFFRCSSKIGRLGRIDLHPFIR